MMENASLLKEIGTLLREITLVDGHNDLPWQLRQAKLNSKEVNLRLDNSQGPDALATDIPRLRAGGVGAQFWAAYVPATLAGPAAVQLLFEQIDRIIRMVAAYPETFELALSAAETRRVHRRGKIASLIGIEGGHCIANSLAVLRMAFAVGARYLTLTHVKNNDWADAAGDEPLHRGLTPFGKQVILEMNRLGMMVDLSHVSDDTMRAALGISRAPVIFSHSSARAICNSPRNVPDDVLEKVHDNGGVVMVCFLPAYLNEARNQHSELALAERRRLEILHHGDAAKIEAGMQNWRASHPSPQATLADAADHVDHVRDVAGIDNVGLGSDFDGFRGGAQGLSDVSCFPALLIELRRRGYTKKELAKIAGLNLLRVMHSVQKLAGSPPATQFRSARRVQL